MQQAQTLSDQQRIQDFIGTPDRLSTLRGDCLVRDRHRCVITHAFDIKQALDRQKRHAQPPDDDGNPIDMDNTTDLEVAHILPYALTKLDDGKLV